MKKKVNSLIYIVLIMLSVGIVASTMLNYNYTYSDIRNLAFNIINAKDMKYNEIYGDYVYYKPSGFEQQKGDNQVKLTGPDAQILIHFGSENIGDYNLYTKMNLDKEKKYEYVDENNKYFYVWEYDQDYNLVVVGENDTYIEALISKNKEKENVLIVAQIFSSINKLEQ